jgi:2-oxoisovalerate dehydrogenase E1 component
MKDLLAIWRDMCAIRNSNRLNEIKTKERYKGVAYNHAARPTLDRTGSAAVGMAVLARARRSRLRLASQPRRDSGQGIFGDPASSTTTAPEIMRSYRDGALLGRSNRDTRPAKGAGAPLLHLRRLQRDLRARDRLQSRLGGSMHAFFAPFGIYPTTPSSAAPDRWRRARRSSSASTESRESSSRTSAIRSFGCGPVWEGITFSAMDQYRTLWDESSAAAADHLQLHEQLLWHGRQPFGETMGVQYVARLGAGVNPEQMHAERVNGYDPLPVIDAFRRKTQLCRRARAGPARHGDVPHQRAFAVRRVELPVEGRDRALAAGRFDSARSATSCSSNGSRTTRARSQSESSRATFDMFPLAIDLEASPRSHSTPSWSAR